MSQKFQTRLEQLINQGEDILSRTITKQDALGIVRDFLSDEGPERFSQWILSSKKVLKLISEEDYNSFLKAEKPIGYDSQPNILKRLIPILRASLDDLSIGIIDNNFLIEKQIPSQSYVYNIGNVGSMANNNTNSTMTQASTNNVQILKGNFNLLASKLRSCGVDDKDIEELQTIIDVTPLPQSSSEYSSALQDWLKKMMGKAIDGSWQIAIGAAGSILATGLQNFFGLTG